MGNFKRPLPISRGTVGTTCRSLCRDGAQPVACGETTLARSGSSGKLPGVAVVAETSPAEVTMAYCSRARRLRARYGGDASRLYGALRALAAEVDAPVAALRGEVARPVDRDAVVVRRIGRGPTDDRTGVAALLVGLSPACESAVRRFVPIVRDAAEGVAGRTETLTYDGRVRLLRQADAMGIKRFHANLVIAAVLHGNGAGGRPARAVADGPSVESARGVSRATIDKPCDGWRGDRKENRKGASACRSSLAPSRLKSARYIRMRIALAIVTTQAVVVVSAVSAWWWVIA